MHWLRAVATSAVILAVAARSAADDSLARARLLYNDGQFDAAVEAADQARQLPSQVHLADLVAGRAYLERFRSTTSSDDLTNARERFRRITPTDFSPRERGEYIVGLGETLFFDGAYGAAATVFDSVLQGQDLMTDDARERVLDWWATAVDRDARPRPEDERQAIYKHVRDRMEEELTTHPGFGAASFWLAAATRAQGDLQSAWDAVLAGWVRAPLASKGSDVLRVDLDRLMESGIIPDRARAADAPIDALKLQWEEFKEKWKP